VGFDLGVLAWAVVLVSVLTLVLRWVFKPSRPATGRPQYGAGANLGLLTPVVSQAPRAQALRAKTRLSGEGIRCSVSRRALDCYDVLVFAGEADRARRLLDT
jgi:hypothetical protein